jgi:thioredoxin-related protein
MRFLFAAFALMLVGVSGPAAADVVPDKAARGEKYELPSWFKISFLDLPDDLKEATANRRQLMLFFRLEDCPYCARLLRENFRTGPTKEFIAHHFDVIALDVRGSQTVNWFDGRQYPEKVLAEKLKVYATPTIIFLDADGTIALQLSGFRNREKFRHELEYVQQQAYRRESLESFVARQKRESESSGGAKR